MSKNNNHAGEVNSSSAHIRKCISCGKKAEKENFLRIMQEHITKKIIINPDNKTFGRSSYICQDENCLKIAVKKNRFYKSLKTQINEGIIEELKKMIISR